MAICLNKERSTGEYQTKLKQSGISQFRFDVFVSNFKERHGRYPELDEIPGADSENYIIESLGIKKEGDFNMIAKEDLMNKLGVESIQQAQIKLNNIYRDKEITVVPLVDSCIVNIKNRPSKYGESSKMSVELQNIFDTAPDAPASIVLSTIVEGLSDKYGIGIRPPDINLSDYNFKVVDNDIVYGLGKIKGVGDAKLPTILKNRPYTSLKDAYDKNIINKN